MVTKNETIIDNSGFIKLHRKIMESQSYSRGFNYFGLMCWLVMNANWKDKFHNGSLCKRGQIFTGLNELSKITGFSIRTLRTMLKNLVLDEFMTIKSTNKGSIITICKYETYQSKENTDDNQTDKRPTNDRQTTDKRPTTTNELKNIKKDKNNITCYSFDDFWNDYQKKGNRKTSEQRYSKIKESDRQIIKNSVKDYVNSTPDIKFRKDAQSWLLKECWNDEIINYPSFQKKESQNQNTEKTFEECQNDLLIYRD